MKNNNPNIIDKFLKTYDTVNANTNSTYKRVYKRPSKIKCIGGFIFSLLMFIFLIRLFVFKFFYFVFLITDLLILAYYGLNLFTKKGIALPTFIQTNEEKAPEQPKEIATTNNEKTYRIDR